MMRNSSNCRRNKAQDDPSRVGTLWKTFPEVPIVSRVVSRQSRIASRHSSGTRTRVTGGLRNVGCSRATRCVRIVKFSRNLPGNSLDSVNPDSQPAIDSQKKDLSLLPNGQVVNFQFVLLDLTFRRNEFCIILQFLGLFSFDIHDEVHSSFPILHTRKSSLSEPDQPIDSLDVVPIFEIRETR